MKEILSKQPGAKDVIVDFPHKTATVAVDKDKFDAKQAIAALADHQFNHSTLKDAVAAGPDAKVACDERQNGPINHERPHTACPKSLRRRIACHRIRRQRPRFLPPTFSTWSNAAGLDSCDHFGQRVVDDRNTQRGNFFEPFPPAGG